MTQQVINVGTAPNAGNGDPDRTAWQKTNANFTELYTYSVGGDLTGSLPNPTVSKIQGQPPAASATINTTDAANISTGILQPARLPSMVGDSGSGGVKGAVPAPAAGDAASGKYLKADGSWVVPPTGGAATSISVGGTSVVGGTSGRVLANNSGTLSDLALATSATTDTTNASNISAGTLPAARNQPVVLGITRAQIASYDLTSFNRFVTSNGAPWIKGSSSSDPNAVQDFTGQWWKLDLSSGYAHALWFGAIGDGATDDTTQLNAALTALGNAGGGILDITGYRYLCTANITVPTGVCIKGPYNSFAQVLSPGSLYTAKSAILMTAPFSISMRQGSSVEGFIVLNPSLSQPASWRTAMNLVLGLPVTGTAIYCGDGSTVNSGCDVHVSHMFIGGYSQAVLAHNQDRTRVEYCHIDCTNGIVINNIGDMGNIAHNRFFPYLTLGYGLQTYSVTGTASNGGLVQLTIGSHQFLANDIVVVAGVGGTTEANGRWIISSVTATTITLSGSTYSNAYTSGGQAAVNAAKRTGKAIDLTNRAGWFSLIDNFSFGYDYHVSVDTSSVVRIIGGGCDNFSSEQDPTTYGVYAGTDTTQLRLIGGVYRAHGYGYYQDVGSSANSSTDSVGSIVGNEFQYCVSAAIYIKTGRASIECNNFAHNTGGYLIQIDNNSYGAQIVGNRADSNNTPISFTGAAGNAQNLTASPCNSWPDTSAFSDREVYDNRTADVFKARYGSATGMRSYFQSARGTALSPTITTSGDKLWTMQAQSFDGANFITAAQIRAISDGAPSTGTSSPGAMVFSVTPSGSQALADIMTIENAGNVIPASNNSVGLGRPSHAWQNVTAGYFGLGTGATTITITHGTGAPSASAVKGSLYIRDDPAGATSRLYINTDGASTWTNVTCAA